jgi:serine/threonine protein kinase
MVDNNGKAGFASAKDGVLQMEGRTVKVPGFRVVGEIGRGANAVVFEAMDEALDRRVALKVWNARGSRRAQLETTKIARLTHPLIVATYQFQLVNEHPFCAMEFVPGESGKQWLAKAPPLEDRVLVWRLYSRAMRFIHDSGEIHGDPHLGNILVFPDDGNAYGHQTRGSALSIKLADTGTSAFWSLRNAILRRESMLIAETASKLFTDIHLNKHWSPPPGLSHQATLTVLDGFANYAAFLTHLPDQQAAGVHADALVEILLATPLFQLDEVYRQARAKGLTTKNRIQSRITARLLHIERILDVTDDMQEGADRLYATRRQEFLAALHETGARPPAAA